jgi:hypothetical protein
MDWCTMEKFVLHEVEGVEQIFVVVHSRHRLWLDGAIMWDNLNPFLVSILKASGAATVMNLVKKISQSCSVSADSRQILVGLFQPPLNRLSSTKSLKWAFHLIEVAEANNIFGLIFGEQCHARQARHIKVYDIHNSGDCGHRHVKWDARCIHVRCRYVVFESFHVTIASFKEKKSWCCLNGVTSLRHAGLQFISRCPSPQSCDCSLDLKQSSK